MVLQRIQQLTLSDIFFLPAQHNGIPTRVRKCRHRKPPHGQLCIMSRKNRGYVNPDVYIQYSILNWFREISMASAGAALYGFSTESNFRRIMHAFLTYIMMPTKMALLHFFCWILGYGGIAAIRLVNSPCDMRYARHYGSFYVAIPAEYAT